MQLPRWVPPKNGLRGGQIVAFEVLSSTDFRGFHNRSGFALLVSLLSVDLPHLLQPLLRHRVLELVDPVPIDRTTTITQ